MTVDVPAPIQNIIGRRSFTRDTIGMSGSRVLCFEDMVLKITPAKEGAEADQECRMMAWLSGKLPVPQILCVQRERGVHYLLMSRTAGQMACAPQWLAQPDQLVRILAQGVRMLQRVDIRDCPRRSTLDEKLRQAEIRVRSGFCQTEDAEPGTYGPGGFQNPAALLQWLKAHRPEERPVFSHGDYCLPNIFLHKGGISGFIDLGRSGIADEYQDIALCYRSLLHNFSGRFGREKREDFDTEALFRELEMCPDWEKLRYYILLDELF